MGSFRPILFCSLMFKFHGPIFDVQTPNFSFGLFPQFGIYHKYSLAIMIQLVQMQWQFNVCFMFLVFSALSLSEFKAFVDPPSLKRNACRSELKLFEEGLKYAPARACPDWERWAAARHDGDFLPLVLVQIQNVTRVEVCREVSVQ